jgi:hypothetical protein
MMSLTFTIAHSFGYHPSTIPKAPLRRKLRFNTRLHRITLVAPLAQKHWQVRASRGTLIKKPASLFALMARKVQMPNTATRTRTVSAAVDAFNKLVGPYTATGAIDDVQPPISLLLHLVQMHAAGWKPDIHDVAALSGISALAIYPGDALSSDAHALIEPERRLAEATGFGYEWLPFADVEDAWLIVRRCINAGRAARVRNEATLLLAGYEEGQDPAARRIHVLGDGDAAETWWGWEEFGLWVERMVSDGASSLGRYTTHIIAQSPAMVARRVINDLVVWSAAPPDAIYQRYPDAACGLKAIADYAAGARVSDPLLDAGQRPAPQEGDTSHGIQRQWSLRRSTAVYLDRVADWALWSQEVNQRLREAAAAYHACHEAWRQSRTGAGPDGSTAAESWLRHEAKAVDVLTDLIKSQGW